MRDHLDEFKTRLLAGPEHGRSRGSHRKLLALAPAWLPVTLVAAVLVAIAAGGRDHASRQVGLRSQALAGHEGLPPGGFTPASFTAISETHWWLLGTAPCRRPPCTSIVMTDSGGRSFVGIPAPRTKAVNQLRFADALDGYAFGPQLWTTHDGGATWKRVSVAGNVTELAAGNGGVFALVRSPHGRGELLRSPSSRDAWRPVAGLVGYPFSGLWVHGATVMVETQKLSGSTPNLMISRDLGNRFYVAAGGGPDAGTHRVPPSIACQFEGAPPVIWALCATGTESGVWRSTDGGRMFAGVGGDATRRSVPSEPNSAGFAAASPTVAVYGYRQLWRTSDGGALWSRVPATSGAVWWTYLGFTDATHGVALGEFGGGDRLYYTTDGGRSYHRVAIRG
jgi:hypothetical protein